MKIDRTASVAVILFGAWLLFTSMLFYRYTAHAVSGSICGALSMVLGVLAYYGATWCRWIAGALAVWVIVSLWLLPDRPPLLVANHMTVATLLFGFAALPTGRGRAAGIYPS